MQKFIASMVLAFVATFVAACGGDTTVTNNFGDLLFTGGNTSVNDNDTITTITGTTAPAPAPIATTTVATAVEDGQMSYKYDIEVRLNDSSLSPFQNGQVERGWANIALTDGQIEQSWLDDEYALIEISVVESSTNVLVTPTLWLGQGMVPQNVQFDDTRVASWNFGEEGYDIPEDGLGFSIQARVSETVPNGIYFVNIRSLVVRSKRDGRLVRMNTNFLTVYRQFQVVDQWNATMCRDGFSYCGIDTQWNGATCVSSVTQIPGHQYCGSDTVWNGFACVSTVTNIPGQTYCGSNTVWNPPTGDCIASIPPLPPQPLLPIAVYGLPTNNGSEVHRGDPFTIHQHLVGTIPAGSTAGLQIRLNGFAQSDLNGPVQVYVNDQNQQQSLTPIPFNGNLILYFWHTTPVTSTLLNIRLVVPTAVSMPTGSYIVEVLTAEVTLPNSTFASVNIYGQQSNILVSN